jgi:carbon starvation protein
LAEDVYVLHGAKIFNKGKDAGFLGIPPTGVWVIILLVYAFVASTLPVTTLLQPRDYINAWQLFIAMGLLIFGVVASGLGGGLAMVAPAVDFSPQGAPPMIPFLFITIACGAISGFHSLVASGTTSKQVANEKDAQFVGYGSMLMEGALAVLVIVAVGAGIGMGYESATGDTFTGVAAWKQHYSSWGAASKGLGPKLTAVVVGSANMMEALHVPRELGIIIMGVFIASFAGTTLDTATRIQRYVVAELFTDIKLKFMANRFAATAFAVVTAAGVAFATGVTGTGAMKLWPMFGAGNQLLAALALLVMTNYLMAKGGCRFLVTGIPCVFMLGMTVWAVVINEINFIKGSNWLLSGINAVVLVLALWMVVEGVIVFSTAKCKHGEAEA